MTATHSARSSGHLGTATAAPAVRDDRPPSTTASLAALLLRLTLAVVIFPHGAQKVLGAFGGPGFSATIDHFAQAWGLAAFWTILVMAAEFLGSIGLLFGLMTRLCALGIGAVMVGAVAFEHAGHGFFMNWQGGGGVEGFEFHLLAIGIALALVVSGGGRWSLDHAMVRRARPQPPR